LSVSNCIRTVGNIDKLFDMNELNGKGNGEKTSLPLDNVQAIQEEMDRHAVDMIMATSKLYMESLEVKTCRPNWRSYLQSSMITQEDFNFITTYETVKGEEKRAFLENNKLQCARTFVSLMSNISKDQTVRCVLTMIDDMIQEDRSRVEMFISYARKEKQSVWTPFLALLTRADGFVINQVSLIITKMACCGVDLMDGADLTYFLTWLKDRLRTPGNEYIHTTARCLQMLLRIEEYRFAFVNIDGISTILSTLAGRANFQLQYQLIFCIWCLTFSPDIAEKMHRLGVISTIAEVVSETSKEKVIRIALATLRVKLFSPITNLLEKPEDASIARENAIQMVQCKITKTLDLLMSKTVDDQEFTEDMEFLADRLQSSVQDLSSFDEYLTEVKSGRLQWSPVHKSEKFWKENTQRFNEKNFEVLKILIKVLEVGNDPLILCVAAHDLGEYVRHYPRGKTVIEQLNGKTMVMRLLTHEDPNVRYHALLSVQKIMVHNWEYLGKQLEKENQENKQKLTAPNRSKPLEANTATETKM
ncbi:putative V-type proton ATPase subunit H 2, partial [Trichinella murrelli]